MSYDIAYIIQALLFSESTCLFQQWMLGNEHPMHQHKVTYKSLYKSRHKISKMVYNRSLH